MRMMYFEYSIDMDRLNLQFDVSIGKIINDEIYQESVGSFFNKLVNVFISYINECQ